MNFKKKLIWLIAVIYPPYFIEKAFTFLTKPMQFKLLPHEKKVLDTAKKNTYKFQDFDIQCYQWGKGNTRILMVHGWEGHAGNFAKLIPLLTKNDYTVYAFDGPSHGASSREKTSPFEFTKLVEELIKLFKVTQIVSHSFGGVAALGALGKNPEIQINRYVAFTIPNKFSERIREVCSEFGLPKKVIRQLIDKIEREEGVSVETLNVEDYAKQSSVHKALLLHDINDRILPIRKSAEVAEKWKNAELVEVKNTGHYKILTDSHSLNITVSFLTN